MTVELTYIRNGVASAPYRRQIDWEKGLILSIDTPENTNSAQAVITYETDAQRNAVISVNETSQQVVLTGSDSISIQLEEFSNEVSVRCALDDMTDVIYRKSIYSDRIAPVLRFYEKVDAISVEEDHFLLTGETEPGCKLTVKDVYKRQAGFRRYRRGRPAGVRLSGTGRFRRGRRLLRAGPRPGLHPGALRHLSDQRREG